MAINWTQTLAEQLDWHWRAQLRPRLDGLTDAEYRWEPVPGSWSLRPREDARTPMAAGAGDTVADFDHPEPVPAPMTTIAWRMGHVAVGVLGMRAAAHFGMAPEPFGGHEVSYATTDWPLSADGGLALLDRAYLAWSEGVAACTEQDLQRPCGPAEGPYADAPFAALVLHINREVVHHGAEIALLRDLYLRRDELGRA